MSGRTLGSTARTLKSANAGASLLTFDISFHNEEDLRAGQRALTAEAVAERYAVSPSSVDIYVIPKILAIKVTVPRSSSQGSMDERDFDGVQQHAHLLELPL
jgi:hypothetical protein